MAFPSINSVWEEFIPDEYIQVLTDDKAVNQRYSVTLGDNMKTNINAKTRYLEKVENLAVQRWLKEIRLRGVFDLSLDSHWFQYAGTLASPNTTWTVSSAQAVGSSIIPVTGPVIDLQSLPNGSYLQFTGHKKIYTVLASTTNTITISPSLYKSVALNEAINLSALVGSYRVKEHNVQQTGWRGVVYDFQFEEELPL